MTMPLLRTVPIALIAMALTACGGGGGGGSGGGTPVIPTEPTEDAIEVEDVNADLSNRSSATSTADMTYILLDGEDPVGSATVTFTYNSGAVADNLLNGTNIDDPDAYVNPANGEFSRIVLIEPRSLFGVVGLDVQGDLPTTGTTMYNEGWVNMTAILEEGTYGLTGDATFEAAWNDGGGNINGRFFNLSGSIGETSVENQGTIILTDATITGDNFSGGRVTGTGIFAPLNVTSSTSGNFFGPEADELGGVLVFNDTSEDIRVLGAFQAD
ncbi:transferrin-binding protein-like solute binding protein [Yoonia sp. 2307UL14-13]|uniref:transferrin-binding protein-like solute binding protein n=1 Tax=Yoonia sp. 2307UL14-13 TaxID=3126506 RepID=UPI0030B09C09